MASIVIGFASITPVLHTLQCKEVSKSEYIDKAKLPIRTIVL